KVRRQGLVCTQITIELDAAAGQSSSRTWRIEDMQENAIADRLRWQAEGWLAGAAFAAHAGAGPKPGTRRGGEDPHLLTLVDEPTPAVEDISADCIIALPLIAAALTTPIRATMILFEDNTAQITHTPATTQWTVPPDSISGPRPGAPGRLGSGRDESVDPLAADGRARTQSRGSLARCSARAPPDHRRTLGRRCVRRGRLAGGGSALGAGGRTGDDQIPHRGD